MHGKLANAAGEGKRESRACSGFRPAAAHATLRARDPGEVHVMIDKVNLAEKFALFHSRWDPKIVGELNGQQVKLVRFMGDFVWHHHEAEDELFLVVKGEFVMEFRDARVPVREGELIVVPRGVEHRPTAAQEVQVLLFEPATTLNTGNTRSERTVEHLERI